MAFSKARPKILVIDDESVIREFISDILSDRFDVLTAGSGLEGIRLVKMEKPDVVLLDILMPGDDGIACLQELRAHPETARLPVLMLTALDEPLVRIRAFNAGADDFVAKPFRPDELIARIESKLKRFRKLSLVTSPVIHLGDVTVDLGNLRVTVAGEEISLGPVEFRILTLLMRHQNRLTRREDLETFVWSDQAPSERGLDTHIFSLRRKLRSSELLLQTVYGTGYTLSVKPSYDSSTNPDVH